MPDPVVLYAAAVFAVCCAIGLALIYAEIRWSMRRQAERRARARGGYVRR